MPTPTWVDGFEFQFASATTFAAGGTAVYDAVTGTVTFDTTNQRTGSACLSVTATAGQSRITKVVAAGNRNLVLSIYVRFPTSLPAADSVIFYTIGPTNPPRITFRQSTSKLSIGFGQIGTDFGGTLVADTWYRVDAKFDVSAATFTGTASLDGAAEQTNTRTTQTAADLTTLVLGWPGNQTTTCLYDDWVHGVTLADYPMGAHAVELLKPTSDGTHNAGTNVIEANGGADIGGGTTAYNLIDEVPPESTDYIQQSAAGSGNYAEVVFATPSAGTHWGTSYWCAIEGAAANASDMLMRVVDSGGSTLLDQGGTGAVSGTTRRYSAGYLAGNPSGNKGRVGFATDVTPVPRALTFVVQRAYVPSTGETDFMGMIPL